MSGVECEKVIAALRINLENIEEYGLHDKTDIKINYWNKLGEAEKKMVASTIILLNEVPRQVSYLVSQVQIINTCKLNNINYDDGDDDNDNDDENDEDEDENDEDEY